MTSRRLRRSFKAATESQHTVNNLKQKQKKIGKSIEKQMKEDKIKINVKTDRYVPKKNYIALNLI